MGEADRIDLDEFRLDHDALAHGDWDRAQRLHHPDIEWHTGPEWPDGDVYRGREAVRRGIYEGLSEVAEWSVEPRKFTPAGDQLLVEARMRTKARHTGLEFEFDLFQVWTFKGGLATKQEAFRQRDEALEAAGLGQ